jgi:hypothetical protein
MDTKEFIEKINILEKKLNLCALRYVDFNPWPHIRISVFNRWNLTYTQEATKHKKRKIDVSLKLKHFFYSVIYYLKNQIKPQSVDVVYFTRMDWFEQNINGKCFNKHSDSFLSIFSEKYLVKVIEMGPISPTSDLYTKDKIYISILLKFARLRSTIASYIGSNLDRNNMDLPVTNEINKEISRVFDFNVEYIDGLRRIDTYARLFERILSKYNPKAVFLECFYYEYGMAISLACHRLGINCVEYQHGAPNNYQLMYARWNNIPNEGYETIPSVFWMWGDSPRKVIDHWMCKTQAHRTIVGGNLWMIYYKTYYSNKNLNLKKHYKSGRVNILVTLYGDEYFPEYLLNTILCFSNNHYWHFRNHPTNPISTELKNKILALPNTEIEFSSNALLFDLFPASDIHITGYSTAAFEAQSFEIPTIFTHINAKNGYSDLIGRNGLYYTNNEKKASDLIKKLSISKQKIHPEYIVSDVNIAYSAMSKIMKVV